MSRHSKAQKILEEVIYWSKEKGAETNFAAFSVSNAVECQMGHLGLSFNRQQAVELLEEIATAARDLKEYLTARR